MELNIDNDLRRSFVGPDEETEYFIGSPNAEDIRGADWHYSKIYTKCLSEGLPTSAELMDILKKRGIIGEHFERRVSELHAALGELIGKLETADNNEEKAEYAMKVSQAREALYQWNQRLSGPMSNTCEQIADDARLEYLTSCILQKKDGKKVWADYDAFLATNPQALTMKARYEVMLYLQGYDSDFLNKTPEARAIREVEADLIRQASEVSLPAPTDTETVEVEVVAQPVDDLGLTVEPKTEEVLKKKTNKKK